MISHVKIMKKHNVDEKFPQDFENSSQDTLQAPSGRSKILPRTPYGDPKCLQDAPKPSQVGSFFALGPFLGVSWALFGCFLGLSCLRVL